MLLPFTDNGGHWVIGTFNSAEMFLYPSPDLCLDTILEVYRQFLGLHGLVCTLTCIVNSGTHSESDADKHSVAKTSHQKLLVAL